MSLVDYAASDDDVSDSEAKEEEAAKHEPPLSLPQTNNPRIELSSSNQGPESDASSTASAAATSIVKLPDASLLLNSRLIRGSGSGSDDVGDHASRVAAAMAESASRKRESKGLAASALPPRSKIPRGNLPHSKNFPETDGGTLLPPQLRGRSNVVTEDIGKLFVKRHADPRSN